MSKFTVVHTQRTHATYTTRRSRPNRLPRPSSINHMVFKENKDGKHSRLSHLKNEVSSNPLVSCRGRVVVIVCACPTPSTSNAQLEKLNYLLPRLRHVFEAVPGKVLFTLCTCICVRYTNRVI